MLSQLDSGAVYDYSQATCPLVCVKQFVQQALLNIANDSFEVLVNVPINNWRTALKL